MAKTLRKAPGASRIIIKAVYKQGLERRDEAEELIDNTRLIIGQMGKSQYGVYQETEKDMFEKLIEGLQKGDEMPGYYGFH